MTDQLSVYNGALRELGDRSLASLSENREPRRVLDEVYDAVLRQALESAQWRFASRSVAIDSDPDITTDFGYQHGFSYPEDHRRTCKLCTDESFMVPLLAYLTEGKVWYADLDPLYVQYVSDNINYGLDLTKWPAAFTLYVETLLAVRIAPRITGFKGDITALEKLARKRGREAEATDAMESPTTFPPPGRLVQARHGRSNSSDRGSRSRLIG